MKKSLFKSVLKRFMKFQHRAMNNGNYIVLSTLPMMVTVTSLPLLLVSLNAALLNGLTTPAFIALIVSASLWALSGLVVPSEEKYRKEKIEARFQDDIRSMKEVSSDTRYGELASALASTFLDVETSYLNGKSAITDDEMAKAKALAIWSIEALDSLNQQNEEIVRMRKYVKTQEETDQLASMISTHEALVLRLEEANAVMSGYYRDILETHKASAVLKQEAAQGTLDSYPTELAQELTYLRKAEDGLESLKLKD